MTIGVVVSTLGALNGWILLQGQIPLAAARDKLFPTIFGSVSKAGVPVFGLVVSSILVTGLMFMNYTRSLVDQFTFIILQATLTTLLPYAYSAAAELMLLVSEPAKFSGTKLARDGLIALLALAYSVWAIYGSGKEVVLKGTILLLASIPIYIWMKWQYRTTAARPVVAPAGAAET